jgi:hypothetical protein
MGNYVIVSKSFKEKISCKVYSVNNTGIYPQITQTFAGIPTFTPTLPRLTLARPPFWISPCA